MSKAGSERWDRNSHRSSFRSLTDQEKAVARRTSGIHQKYLTWPKNNLFHSSQSNYALNQFVPSLHFVSFSDTLFYGAICSFVAGVLLLMSFASPYWLVSWEDTQSPFQNMGLWEFCFFKFRHPDYQFDHLFHGCHALYGDEYRLIREKLLPGKYKT